MSESVEAEYVPPAILRNKGVPITLYRLEANGERMMTGEGDDAQFVTHVVHLRFDANAVADIEEMFDGLRAMDNIVERVPLTNPDGSVRTDGSGTPLLTEIVRGQEERVFYGLQAFQKAMEIRSASTVRRVIATAFRTTPETIGAQMVDGLSVDYSNAVGIAWALSQGVDPTEAAKTLQRAKVAAAEHRNAQGYQLAKTMDEASDTTTDSPGRPGSEDGSLSTFP